MLCICKVDEIFGTIQELHFSVKPADGISATSFKPGDKLYINPEKLLPLQRFLPQPKGAGGAGGKGGGKGIGKGGGKGKGKGKGAPRIRYKFCLAFVFFMPTCIWLLCFTQVAVREREEREARAREWAKE